MRVDTRRKIVGFDRKIQLRWLDATADWAGQGHSPRDIREELTRLLAGDISGEGPHSARGKTTTVLMHTWVLTPDALRPLRRDGLALIRNRSGGARLPLHWGMCLATYPFFWDVAVIAGRLLALQASFSLSQVTKRISENWGARSTVIRAARRVIRSLVDWKVLDETAGRESFQAGQTIPVSNEDGACTWLLEAAIAGNHRVAGPFGGLVRSPVFFPFRLGIVPRDVARSKRLEIHHQGLDDDIVMLKHVTAPSKAWLNTQLRLI